MGLDCSSGAAELDFDPYSRTVERLYLGPSGNQPQARKLALWPVRYAVLLAAVGLLGCFGSGHVSAVPASPADRAGDGADGASQYLSHAVLF